MAKVASLLIDVAADVAKVRKDFGEMNGVVQGFGRSVQAIGDTIKAAIGAWSFKAVADQVWGLIESVGALGEKADTMALSTDEMQAFSAALRDAGVSAESAASLMGKAARSVGDALQGNKGQIEFFKELGVGLQDAQGKAAPMADVMARAAAAILAVEDPARRVALASQFMGKSGREAIPALQQLAKGAAALKEEFAGEIIPESVIARFDTLGDKVGQIGARIRARSAIALGDIISPELISQIDKTVEAFDKIFTDIEQAWNDLGVELSTFKAMNPASMLASTREEFELLGKAIVATINFLRDSANTFREWGATVAAAIMKVEVQLQSVLGSPADKAKASAEAARLANIAAGISISNTVGMPAAPPPVTSADMFMGPQPLGRRRTVEPNPYTSFPAVKDTGGVDKFAEAMRRINAEIVATEAAMKAFAEASKLPTKEAERYAKLQADIGLKQSEMIKGVPAGQVDAVKAAVKKNEELKFSFEQVKLAQREADTVNSKYADGTKTLADQMFYLNLALEKNLIGQREYNAALDDYNDKAELQREVNAGLGEGFDQIAAGWRHAALTAEQSQSSFAMGQELFTETMSTMSAAISEFVTTGEINFAKLAQSFAQMLADMAIKWALAAVFRSLIGGGEFIPGSSSFVGPMPRSVGGSVRPGAVYTVGEMGPERFEPAGINDNAVPIIVGARGPERFVPAVAGRIVPSTNVAPDFDWMRRLVFGGNRATGGLVTPYTSYNVGEHGPERFVPAMAGRVEPMSASDGDGTVIVNLDMKRAEGARDPSSALEFGRRVKAAVVDVIANEKRPGGSLYTRKTA